MKKIKKVQPVIEKVVKKIKKVPSVRQSDYTPGKHLPHPSQNKAAIVTCYNPPHSFLGCVGCFCEDECVCRLKYKFSKTPSKVTKRGKK